MHSTERSALNAQTPPPTLLVVGVGRLGSVLLELLAREAWPGRIVAASRSPARAEAHCNLARLGALAQGAKPRIEFEPLDLDDRASTVATIQRLKPDLILSTASRLTWWLPGLLPAAPAARLGRAGFGPWLPVHMTLSLKLMEAVRETGYGGHTLTASFPDVVNCALAKRQLAPTCGVGNLAEVVPKVEELASRRLRVDSGEVKVTLVAHHALQSAVFAEQAERPPYFLRIEHRDRDVTDEVDGDALLFAPYPLPPGPAIHFLTAGSAVRLARALCSEDETRLHAPAPGGLPGGYPVIVDRNGVRPAPIRGLSLEQAIEINERSHRYDGIERIEADGTVVLRDDSAAVLREELGYDCPRLAPSETAARADELLARLREYAARHGTPIERETE